MNEIHLKAGVNCIFYEKVNDTKIDCKRLYYSDSVNVRNCIYFATVMHYL